MAWRAAIAIGAVEKIACVKLNRGLICCHFQRNASQRRTHRQNITQRAIPIAEYPSVVVAYNTMD